jgi:hypothetical protein
MATNSNNTPSIAGQLRRRRGSPISRRASAVPAEGHSSFFNRFSALVAAVVKTVNVVVCAPVPVIVTELGERLHVAGSLAATGLIEQVRLTVPVNPFAGVTVMVAVLPVVAPGTILIDELLPPPSIVKVDAGFTVKLCGTTAAAA